MSPFLLFLGDVGHLVVENKLLLNLDGLNNTDCILALMGAYYIFDLHYSPQVKPTLLFLQAHVMKMPDDLCDRVTSLSIMSAFIVKKQNELHADEVNASTSSDVSH